MRDAIQKVRTLGDLLRLRRGSLTLREAAKVAGMSHTMLTKYENGHHEPRIGRLVVLARVLDFTKADWQLVRELVEDAAKEKP